MKVLVCAAHPDDEVLGAGGTIARHVAAGDEVVVVIAADCASARGGREVCLPEAAREAATVLGTSVRFCGLPGMTLARIPEVELNRHFEDAVRTLRPDVVYTHHVDDPNSDHRAVAAATLIAVRPVGPWSPARVLSFETPSSTEWGWGVPFRPTVFVDVTDTLDRKLAAMTCYAEELRPAPHPRNLDSLTARASYWGQIAGVRYAEAFALVREIVR